MLRRAITVAAVIGTLLTVINQGDVLVTGRLSSLGLLKIGLTYLVPFGVSVYSALAMGRRRLDGD
jgi:hypothetical protein